MNGRLREFEGKPKQFFRLRFFRHLQSIAALHHRSLAESFGIAWERAIEEIPLNEEDQAAIYWDLIDSVRSQELFTSAD